MEKYLNMNTGFKGALAFLLLLASLGSHAHFGSKGPFGGTVTCTVTAGDTIYMGTADGGVYESTNASLVGWRARPVGLKSGKITAIAHTGKYLYAATADSGIFVFNGYEGTDRYWNKASTGLTYLQVTSLVAVNATTLLAGTTGGLFLSADAGHSWAAVNTMTQQISKIAVTQGAIVVTTNTGIYVTSDSGAHWIAFNDSNTGDASSAGAISINASTHELMLFNQHGLFVTASALTTANPVYTSALGNLPAGIIVNAISNDGTSWYLATNKGVFTSSAATLHWNELNTGLATLEVKTVVPFKTGLVCGTVTKGIYKASLPFVSWTEMNVNFNNLKTTAMHTSGTGFVVAATEKGVYVSRGIAANYVAANKGLIDSLHVNDLIMAEHFLFAATRDGGVYVSPDSGKNWSAATTGMVGMHIRKLFYSNNTLYAIADNSIYRSPLTAVNWKYHNNGIPLDATPTSMVFYGNNILLSTLGHGVFIKTTAASTWWDSYNEGLDDWNVTSVAVLGNKLYAGTDGSGVFVSDSAKSLISWQATAATVIEHATTLGLHPMKIQAMASYGGYVWASYKGGLVASADGGATWIEGGNQFNLPSFTDVVKINFVTTRVFVSTENNGLYSNALTEMPEVVTGLRTPVNTDALQIFPNPTTGSFTLNTATIKGQIAQVTILDHSGNVKSRFHTVQDLYTVDYTQGLYVVQVNTTEGAVYTQKMIIQ